MIILIEKRKRSGKKKHGNRRVKIRIHNNNIPPLPEEMKNILKFPRLSNIGIQIKSKQFYFATLSISQKKKKLNPREF